MTYDIFRLGRHHMSETTRVYHVTNIPYLHIHDLRMVRYTQLPFFHALAIVFRQIAVTYVKLICMITQYNQSTTNNVVYLAVKVFKYVGCDTLKMSEPCTSTRPFMEVSVKPLGRQTARPYKPSMQSESHVMATLIVL